MKPRIDPPFHIYLMDRGRGIYIFFLES